MEWDWLKGNERTYYTLDNVLLYKNNKAILLFYGKVSGTRDSPMDDQTILQRETIGKQFITTGSVLKSEFYPGSVFTYLLFASKHNN